MGTGCGQGANRYTSETNMSAQRFILGNPKGEEDRHLLLWLPRDSTLLVIDVKAVFCFFFLFFYLKAFVFFRRAMQLQNRHFTDYDEFLCRPRQTPLDTRSLQSVAAKRAYPTENLWQAFGMV